MQNSELFCPFLAMQETDLLVKRDSVSYVDGDEVSVSNAAAVGVRVERAALILTSCQIAAPPDC